MDPMAPPVEAAQKPLSAPLAVQLVSSTWARDSHDLFDFEAHNLHKKSFTVAKTMKCIRAGTDVQVLDSDVPLAEGSDLLLRVVQKEGSFWVDKASASSSSKKLWLVVRDLATCCHRLSEGDIIKLGRFKFRIRQLVSSGSGAVQPELRFEDNGRVCKVDSASNKDLASTMCRICLLEGPGEGDPLITPCQCKGSIEYVHLGCLRHWIRGRLNLSDRGAYFYRPLPCELCKTTYPAYVNVDDARLPLVEVPHTGPPFVVLENMVRDSHQHATRGLHVISLAENKCLKLGRGHESDVRIADVSISRWHASIRFEGGQFVLEDNNSKFGTLVAMKKPRPLAESSGISIQVGRTVLALSLQPNAQHGLALPPRGGGGSSAQEERALRLSLMTRAAAAQDNELEREASV